MTETQEKKRNPWWLIALACLGIAATLLLTLWLSLVEPYRRQERLLTDIRETVFIQNDPVPPVSPFYQWFGGMSGIDCERYEIVTLIPIPMAARAGQPGPRFPDNADAAFAKVLRLPFVKQVSLYQDEPLPFKLFEALIKQRRKRPADLYLPFVSLAISDEQVDTLPEMPQIKSLSLSLKGNPGLTNRGVAEMLRKCPNLEAFRFDGDKTPLGPEGIDALNRCTSLESLFLHDVGLTDERFADLTVTAGLQTLGLIGNPDLTDATAERIQGLPHLNELYLNGCGITDEGVAHLAGLTSLTTFSLYKTQIPDEGVKHLATLTSLEYLFLPEGISGEALGHLKGLPLVQLGLPASALDDAGITHLKAMTGLNALSLSGPEITNETLDRLQDAGLKLQVLVLSETAVTQLRVDEFQLAVPDCRVIGP